MKAYFDSKVVADIPDFMIVGDTIILKRDVYEIITKTIDLNVNEIFCKIQKYENNTIGVVDVLEYYYDSPYFTTSGANTNEIENNPRLIVLTGILSVIMEKDHLMEMIKSYRTTIISKWNDINISWDDIFYDNPAALKNAKDAAPIVVEILKNSKISTTIWPINLV